MDPNEVTSPKRKLRNLVVVYTHPTDRWSLATFEWLHDDGEWRPRVGMRWDGAEGYKGNPVSTGHATWFCLPEPTDVDAALKLFEGKNDA